MKTITVGTWALVVGLIVLLGQPAGNSAPGTKQVAPLPSPGIVIGPQGFVVTPCVSGRCTHGRLMIPRNGGGYDYAGLREALVKLRSRYAKPRGVTVSGSRTTRWNTLVQTMAHARITRDGKPLFPVVFLAVVGG